MTRGKNTACKLATHVTSATNKREHTFIREVFTMTRGKNTMRNFAISAALAMLLCFNMVLPVFAGPIFGTSEAPADIALTKILTMGEGVTTPDVTFTFEFTSVSVNDIPATETNMPVLGTRTIGFSAMDVGTTLNGVKTVPKETAPIFANITWPHAGVFTYTVTERQYITETLATGEAINFSQAEYEIVVYVANGPDGGLFIAAIASIIEVTDGIPGTERGDKVDGTPGGDPDIDGDYSKVTFTNRFARLNSLVISKVVNSAANAAHDFANRERFFNFEVTVTKSNANPNTAQTYRAFVRDESGAVITGEDNYAGIIETDPVDGAYIVFTTGEQKTVNLKHGQWLSFPDLEAGAAYTVTELGVEHFTPSCNQTVGEDIRFHQGTANTNLVIPTTLITEIANRADFVNTYRTITPVGISVDNLPYIILIVLGAAALTAYIVVKSRKKGYVRHTVR